MKINELGEFGLIQRQAANIGNYTADVMIGIGDDAAVVRSGALSVLTTDLMIENVHFKRDMPFHALGYKSVAVSISDIAAMAADPKYVLSAIGLPDDVSVEEIDELYRGMIDCAESYGAQIVGGDTSSADAIVICVTATGEALLETIHRRDQARIGDVILVTGALGASAGGLAAIAQGRLDAYAESLIRAHRYPVARVSEAKAAARAGCRALADISDGLSRDLGNICRASGVGAEVLIEKIPVAPALEEAASALDIDPVALAVTGGEDYELVMTAPKEAVSFIIEEIRAATGTPVSAVGRIVAGDRVSFLSADDKERHFTSPGYDHFSKGKGERP